MRMTEEEYQEYQKRMKKPSEISFGFDMQKAKEKKPSKYRSRKALYVDPVSGEEITFDSEKERDYYLLLKIREKKGEIRDIQRQVSITIQPSFELPNGEKIRAITYRADFVYYDILPISKEQHIWPRHVVDVKGYKTEIYKLKKKLLAYRGIIIEEV